MRKESYAINYDRELSKHLTNSIMEILSKPRNKSALQRFINLFTGKDFREELLMHEDFHINVPTLGRFKVKFIAVARWYPPAQTMMFPYAEMGFMTDRRTGEKSLGINLIINKNRIKYLANNPKKYKPVLYGALSHEITHAFDPKIHAPDHQGTAQIAQKDFFAYANNEVEVTARIREMINYLEDNFDRLYDVHSGDRKNMFFGLFEIMPSEQLGHWQTYTPDNKKRVWKALVHEMDKLSRRNKRALAQSNPIDVFLTVLSDAVLVSSSNLSSIADTLDAIDYSMKYGFPKMQDSGFDMRNLSKVFHKNYTNGVKKTGSEIKPKLLKIGRTIDTFHINDFKVKKRAMIHRVAFLSTIKSLIKSPSRHFDANEFLRILKEEFTVIILRCQNTTQTLRNEIFPALNHIARHAPVPSTYDEAGHELGEIHELHIEMMRQATRCLEALNRMKRTL